MSATPTRTRPRPQVLLALGIALALLAALGTALWAKSARADADHVSVPASFSGSNGVPPAPLLMTMGDSIPAGSSFGGQACTGFPLSTATAIGWRWGCTAVGGSGYVSVFQADIKPFEAGQAATAIDARPDVIVIVGSSNDIGSATPEQVRTAAAALYRHLRSALPSTRIAAVGPVVADPAKVFAAEPYADALREATAEAGVAFIDPNAEGWLTRAPRSMIGLDGLHPTPDGHLRIAQILGADLARLGYLPAVRP